MTWHTAEFQGEFPVKKEEEKEEIFDLVCLGVAPLSRVHAIFHED